MMRMGGCPMAGAQMTPEIAEKGRALAIASERGTITAPNRPALGFMLDMTTLAQVHAWQKRERVDCDEPRKGALECKDVPAIALGEPSNAEKVDDLALEFSPDGHLVNMTTWRSHLTAETASKTALEIVSSLQATLGPTEDKAGDFAVARLGAAPAYSVSTVAYHFSDYIAEVTAMNAPSSGPSIREHYMSARD